jgi:hypothetical protein
MFIQATKDLLRLYFVCLFQIFDPNNARFEPPLNVTQYSNPPQDTDYAFEIQVRPFGIRVYRKSTGMTL